MGSADEQRCVLVFESIHGVMCAEKELKALGVWYDLIPTPRQISSDCGMAIEVRGEDVARVLPAFTSPDCGFTGCYRLVDGSYEQL